MRLAAQPFTDTLATIAWEECACLLCGCAHHTPLFEATDPLTNLRFLIVRCQRCSLAFTNPRPNLDSMARFYPDDYRCHQSKNRLGKTDTMTKLLPIHGQARLLDFGCGAGDFLRRMTALGWNATGIDCSEIAVARLQAHGLSAQVGTLPNPLWTDASFEAITMRQSLEHTHEPLEVMHAAHRLLTPGGKLLIAVPNFDGVAASWFGVNWHGLDLPRHLTHFTPATLHLMLKQAGFERIEMRQERRASWIRHSAQLAQQRGDRATMTRLLTTRIGSGLASWCGRWIGRAESILAIATK